MYIAIEGPDNCGKSSVIEAITPWLRKKLKKKIARGLINVREPGTSLLANKIREIVMAEEDYETTDTIDALLFAAARLSLIENHVKPTLLEKDWVLSDRCVMSAMAYQGLTAVDEHMVDVSTAGVIPDYIFYIVTDPNVIFKRIAGNDKHERVDRVTLIERGYRFNAAASLLESRKYSASIIEIDGDQPIEGIVKDIKVYLKSVIDDVYSGTVISNSVPESIDDYEYQKAHETLTAIEQRKSVRDITSNILI